MKTSTQQTASEHGHTDSRVEKIAFVGGAFTASVVFLMVILFLGFRVGFSTLTDMVQEAAFPTPEPPEPIVADWERVLYLPEDIRQELIAIDAVVDSAGNPTNTPQHDTILTRPDDELGYVLRPNVTIVGYKLRAVNGYNIDPPSLYVLEGAEMSDALQSYIDAQARVRFIFTTDAQGHRITLPHVESGRKILVVGDSATFGVGVTDEDTIPSQLQRLLGDSYQVINAGVGGYTGEQAHLVAEIAAAQDDYEALVYVAHHNDLGSREASPESAEELMRTFADLKESYSGRLVVVFLPFLEYADHDFLLSWTDEEIQATDAMRSAFPGFSREMGFEFVDGTDLVDAYAQEEKTIFAPLDLYADHAHLSPRGTHLVAEAIAEALERQGITPHP